MLKPMVIFKGKTKRFLKEVTHRNSNISVTFQAKAWMD